MAVNQHALVSTLRKFEAEFNTGISEFGLISLLQAAPHHVFDRDALRDSLTLFQCHFVLFNALYVLRDQWFEERRQVLDIHATNIQLSTEKACDNTVTADDPLRSYYLDWSHFDSTSAHDVDALIDSFWTRMGNPVVAVDEHDVFRAKALLTIPDESVLSKTLVKKHYHRQQHLHHPDKGGDGALAGQLSWAKQVLLQWCDHKE